MTEKEVNELLELVETGGINMSLPELDSMIEMVSEQADKEAHQLAAEYNIRDTEIVNQLEDKLKLLELVLALSYDSKLNFTDAYTSVRMWDVIIHNYLMERNIVIPQYKYDGAEFSFEGGYVKEPMLGRHEWIVSFDLNSLYPHLIQQYCISPEKAFTRKHLLKILNE